MCCNGYTHPAGNDEKNSSEAGEDLVATPLPDGYWILAFPYSTSAEHPDLIAYGLGFDKKQASINLFLNPKNDRQGSEGWKVSEIQRFDFPVASTFADLTGDGFNDLIICDNYGPSMGDLWAPSRDGGRVQWLKNPGSGGRDVPTNWEAKTIGNSTGMHRLQAGHFTTKEHIQVMGLPIIPASNDLTSPAPIIIYSPVYGKDKADGPKSWTEHTPFKSEFRLIHDAVVVPGQNGLDMVLVSGREGVVLLWFDETKSCWEYHVCGTGLPKSGDNPYWGSGSVDVCRVGDDPVGYIATCEGFHGNIVSVYVKSPDATKGPESLKQDIWRRIPIDDFGPLNKEHTGTVHNVQAIKHKIDQAEAFGIACMGAPIGKPENQGVYAYYPVDLAAGRFEKVMVTAQSAGRLAVAEFEEKGRFDIASISYYVPNYHTGPDPPSVRINRVDDLSITNHLPYTLTTASVTEILAVKNGSEVDLIVPDPLALPSNCTPRMPILTIAGKKITLVAGPPHAEIQLKYRDGVKIIDGSITMPNEAGGRVTRTIAAPAHESWSTEVVSVNGVVTAGEKGVIFIHVESIGSFQGPYTSMDDVTTTNIFPQSSNVAQAVNDMDFPFIQVQDLAWAGGNFDDFAFYNLTGWSIFKKDRRNKLVHMQAWTLGLGDTARFHNHSDQIFCEIHYCLYNGGGNGAMRYFENSYPEEPPIPLDEELKGQWVFDRSTPLVVPSLYEHGPLWKIVKGTKATPVRRANNTVDYPWHAWLSSKFGDYEPLPTKPPLAKSAQQFDIWLAFEFDPSAFQY